jgi:O-antigen/teichoic acid export membrane protein
LKRQATNLKRLSKKTGLQLLVGNISKLISRGHERSVKAKKNILASLLIKGISIVVGFLLVPIALDYVDQTRYGIWLTISAFLGWFAFFEIGLGSGLRNKLAEALAVNDIHAGKIYVSTTYAILTIIIGLVAAIFFMINGFLNWSKILNAPNEMAKELSILALIVFGFFFLRFVLSIITTVLYADQKPALANSFGPIGNVVTLLAIWLLKRYTDGSLLYLGIAMSVSPVFIFIIASLVLFYGKYKNIAPSFSYIKMSHAKSLLGLGIKFFIIQISALVLFETSNIIIAQYFGPQEVTSYNIAYKYFSLISMAITIIITPFWSAYTEAWTNGEINWIKKSVKNLLKFWYILFFFGMVMLIFSKAFYKLWVGPDIVIPFNLSLYIFIYFVSFAFGGIFNMFINGVGKIYLQLVCLLTSSILFFPLNYLFIKVFHMGVESVVLATIISNFYSPIIAPIQYYKLINIKAHGIWNK